MTGCLLAVDETKSVFSCQSARARAHTHSLLPNGRNIPTLSGLRRPPPSACQPTTHSATAAHGGRGGVLFPPGSWRAHQTTRPAPLCSPRRAALVPIAKFPGGRAGPRPSPPPHHPPPAALPPFPHCPCRCRAPNNCPQLSAPASASPSSRQQLRSRLVKQARPRGAISPAGPPPPPTTATARPLA